MEAVNISELLKIPEFRAFKRKRRFRVLVAGFVLAIFWLLILKANNPNTTITQLAVLMGIMVLISILEVYWIYTAFLKRPKIIVGTIEDIRTRKRTVTRADDLETRYIKEYKVCDKNDELWGKNIASYNGGDQELVIGDHVIWFSYENNVGYIVKDYGIEI